MGSPDQARRLVLIAAAGLFAVNSCGGDPAPSDAPSAPSVVNASPSPSTPPSPTPFPGGQPVWIPPGTFDCPLGMGNKDAGCDSGEPVFADVVNAAVDRVIAEQLHLFPNRDITERVRDEEAIHVAIARILMAQGYCAGWDVRDLQVRNSNDFSEHYDLFDSRGFLYQDPARRFRSVCRPADFPLTAAEQIHSIRVGFYGIQCPAGVQRPPNSAGRLPVGCLGHVTATPKDEFFGDIDARIHGPYITWELTQRREYVTMRGDENTEFNQALRAVRAGDFELCATVQGVRGCMAATVTEN